MFDYSGRFQRAFPYAEFLERYGSPDQRSRWQGFHDSVTLTAQQQALLQSFSRDMKVLVLAGTWCGDCVNQCPIFERFAEINNRIQVRYADRDDNPDLAAELTTCGGARVPAVAFLSEDGYLCGRYGDRTLSKYRSIIRSLGGDACPTGLPVENDMTAAVVQDWLDEFERIQWMLRTSSRLRQLHGD
ncbi:MAG: thioredoxin family protein [Planctomycetaceae bacterium]|nr:thioredoxin family protein [Planctomycetaceae bacterium]